MADETPQPYTAADLVEVDYPYSNDRVFETPAGTRFRVKVTIPTRDHAKVGDPVAAISVPTNATISLQLSLVDGANWTEKIGDRFRIFDPHEVQLSAEQLANMKPEDVEDLFEGVIAKRAWQHEQTMATEKSVADYLGGKWGLDLAETVAIPQAQTPMGMSSEVYLPPDLIALQDAERAKNADD